MTFVKIAYSWQLGDDCKGNIVFAESDKFETALAIALKSLQKVQVSYPYNDDSWTFIIDNVEIYIGDIYTCKHFIVENFDHEFRDFYDYVRLYMSTYSRSKFNILNDNNQEFITDATNSILSRYEKEYKEENVMEIRKYILAEDVYALAKPYGIINTHIATIDDLKKRTAIEIAADVSTDDIVNDLKLKLNDLDKDNTSLIHDNDELKAANADLEAKLKNAEAARFAAEQRMEVVYNSQKERMQEENYEESNKNETIKALNVELAELKKQNESLLFEKGQWLRTPYGCLAQNPAVAMVQGYATPGYATGYTNLYANDEINKLRAEITRLKSAIAVLLGQKTAIDKNEIDRLYEIENSMK